MKAKMKEKEQDHIHDHRGDPGISPEAFGIEYWEDWTLLLHQPERHDDIHDRRGDPGISPAALGTEFWRNLITAPKRDRSDGDRDV